MHNDSWAVMLRVLSKTSFLFVTNFRHELISKKFLGCRKWQQIISYDLLFSPHTPKLRVRLGWVNFTGILHQIFYNIFLLMLISLRDLMIFFDHAWHLKCFLLLLQIVFSILYEVLDVHIYTDPWIFLLHSWLLAGIWLVYIRSGGNKHGSSRVHHVNLGIINMLKSVIFFAFQSTD